MKISCQSCQSKYNVADEKVQGKIVKIRCRKCGSTIVVNGTAGAAANGSVAPEPPQAGGAPEGGEQWHVNVNENDQRSMSMADLVEAYNSGVVTQETYIWTDGMDDWKPLSDVDAVVSALHAHAEQAAASGSSDQSQGYAASVVPAYEAEAPEPAAAARTYEAPAPSPSYGSSFAAQAAAAPASEPRRAAVVKREARGRDLFGGGGGDDVQTSAPSMPHATSQEADDAASKLTGERNENSVLFSLAVLTKGGDDHPVHAPSPTEKDDSGLIDLKALAARTESMRPVAPKSDGDVFAAPLGFTPPPMGSPLGVMGGMGGETQAKSKLPLFIGLGAGAALLVVVSVVVGVKVGASNVPAPSATVLAPVTPTAEPTSSVTAEASATASAAPSATVAAATKPKAVGGGGGYHPAAVGVKPPAAGGGAGGTAPAAAGGAAPGAAAPAAAPPKKNDCGCNGDLMCLMKCSTH
jgi:predicted Zn finger-like uncharacterized protein